MTGYLERLVQRHAAVPAVRPRAVSRFEGDLVGRDVGSEPAAPAAAGSPGVALAEIPPAANAIAPASAATPLATTAADNRFDGVAARHPIDGPRPLETSRRPAPAPAPTTPDRIPGQSHAPSDGPLEHAPARLLGAERPTVTPVTIRRADPPTLAIPNGNHALPTRRSAEPAPREPDVVHVHIGRVEVRATVPPREPSRPAPRTARPAPLSLDRYLSGERRT